MNKKISDEQLAILVVGDKKQFEQLVSRYATKIQRYIARVIGNWQESEDITQEVFLKAYINIISFNPKLKFSSWLYRIAHNESVNFIKKNYRTRSVELHDNVDYGGLEDEKILKKIDRDCSGKVVWEAIAKLDAKDREIIELVFFEEKTYIEISDILRMPVNSVGPTLNRVKKKLRKVVEDGTKHR